MSERMLLTLNMLAPNCGTLLGITVLEFNRRWYDALAKPYRLTDTGPLMLLVLSALVNCLVGVAALQVINYAATKFRTRTAIENTEFRSRMKVSLFWLCLVYLIQVVTYGAWWLSLFGMQSFRFVSRRHPRGCELWMTRGHFGIILSFNSP